MKISVEKTVSTWFSHATKRTKDPLHLTVSGRDLRFAEEVKFLGITLDRHLNLNRHCEIMAEKARRRMTKVTRTTGRNWGLSASSLRTLYLALVRSIFEWHLQVLSFCRPQALKPIVNLQKTMAKTITGALSTTPRVVCERLAGLRPIRLEILEKALICKEKYYRDENSPCYRILFGDESRRLNRPTFRSTTENWGEFDIRISNKTVNEAPRFKTRLEFDGITNKTSIPPSELRLRALGDIEDKYPSDTWIRAYTDGSKNKRGSGWGCSIRFPDGRRRDTSGPAGKWSNIFSAELRAILHALREVFSDDLDQLHPIVILSDSQSVLRQLSIGRRNDDTITPVITLLKDLKVQPLIAFQWVPSHVGIEGNDTADRLARRGLSEKKRAMFLSDSNSKIKLATRILAKKIYNEEREGKMGEDMKLNKKDRWWGLNRSHQVILTQLRTGHIPIRPYLNRFRPLNSNLCRLCKRDIENISHITLKCTFLKKQRIRLIPSKLSLSSLLFSKRLKTLRAMAVFWKIALNKLKKVAP